MCDLELVTQLASLDAIVLAERQLMGTLVAAGRLEGDAEWPSVAAQRQQFYERLEAAPERPQELTAEQQEQDDLHRALGVRRAR